MTEHIVQQFDEELDKLRTRLIRMGSLVQEQIELTLRALKTNDTSVARVVIDQDEKVDSFDVKIDKQCMRLFALRQPVAMDLRIIMSALTINNNIERLGDLAVNVAERVGTTPHIPAVLERTTLLAMGEVAVRMVTASLDAFINNDPEAARSVLDMDNEVDRFDRDNFTRLIEIMQEERGLVETCSHLLIVNRNLERIADQATNIAEEVVFLVDAKIIRHKRVEQEQSLPPSEGSA